MCVVYELALFFGNIGRKITKRVVLGSTQKV